MFSFFLSFFLFFTYLRTVGLSKWILFKATKGDHTMQILTFDMCHLLHAHNAFRTPPWWPKMAPCPFTLYQNKIQDFDFGTFFYKHSCETSGTLDTKLSYIFWKNYKVFLSIRSYHWMTILPTTAAFHNSLLHSMNHYGIMIPSWWYP